MPGVYGLKNNLLFMIYDLKSLKDADVKNKTVLLRADLDVPIESGKILDTTRLKAWSPTLKYLLKNQAQVFIAGHLGRPKDEDEKFSLKPVAEWIKKSLELGNKLKAIDINGFKTWAITENVFLLENLRFYKGEEENDKKFSKKLASLAEIYVNDAFASSHRDHASIDGVTEYLPHFAGFRLQKEVEVLSGILKNPKRPLVVIIGGAKMKTKLPLVEKMHHIADFVLVGGEIASHVKELIKVQHEKISGKKSVVLVADLQDNGLDITEKSAQNFVQIIQNGATIVWNGPLGQTGKNPETEKGTLVVAKAIISSKAYSVVGGGDTLSFLKQKNLLGGFGFVSTGGGAMLEFLSGKELPAIKPLLT